MAAWNKENLEGIRYGRLVVLSKSKYVNKKKYCECLCDCGSIKYIYIYKLRDGTTKSCGCLQKTTGLTHGLSKHLLYLLYAQIKARCYNINCISYRNYGGTGVTMCDEWLNDFMAFFNWCNNNGWQKGLEIDKDIIAYNLGVPANIYSPERCQFVTVSVNAQHKRNSNHIEYNGEKKSLGEWSKMTGIRAATIWRRYRIYKWDAEKTFTTPTIAKYRNNITSYLNATN